MKNSIKNNTVYSIKKLLSVLLIIVGFIFIFENKDIYYSTHSSYVKLPKELKNEEPTGPGTYNDDEILDIPSDKIFEQEARGWNGSLEYITLRFNNQTRVNAKGTVTINIKTMNGEILQSSTLPLTSINTMQPTDFYFDNPHKLDESTYYILQIVAKDIYNPAGFGLYTHHDRDEIYRLKGESKSLPLFGQMTEDGKKIPQCLRCTLNYRFYNKAAVMAMIFLLCLALLFCCTPFTLVSNWINQKLKNQLTWKVDFDKLFNRLFFIATPVLCIFLGDRINGFSLSEMIDRVFSWIFLFNLLIYITIWLIVYALVNRIQYTSIIVLTLVFVADLANYYVWQFRGCPIVSTDIQSAQTAMNVAANFTYSLDLTGVWFVIYFIVFVAMILSLNGHKGLTFKKRAFSIGAAVFGIVLFNHVFFQAQYFRKVNISHSVWEPARRYAKNGNAFSFVMSWSYSKVTKPSGYSVEKVKTITNNFESDAIEQDNNKDSKSPNIIAIMNEALADLSYNSPLELSEDYLPFIHSMKENTIQGKLYVSIQGSNTANSEYEFLTGNSMSFLPARCIPYNLYVKDTSPSMAQNMKALGYNGVNAYHPFIATGWNRSVVYPYFGFNNFYALDYYQKTGHTKHMRNLISDESDFDMIIDDYEKSKEESNNPFFLFNVTIQNHGGYGGGSGIVEEKIKVLDDVPFVNSVNQYINLAKESDNAFKKLINYFESVDEPTIIVMFGDHQPPLNIAFYEQQFDKPITELSVEEKSTWYSTPYIIWANYDIEEENLDMSANYLSSYVMNLAGLKLTGYNKFLLDLQKEVPVIGYVGYKCKNGKMYMNGDESEYSDKILEYQMIQYNQLFDTKNRLDDFFFLKEQ